MSNMSDEELDRNWQPNGRRPQSTMARSFSAELMDIFRIENSVSDLDSQVDKRKQTVGNANDELASLEAQLAKMEALLKQSKGLKPQNTTASAGGSSEGHKKPLASQIGEGSGTAKQTEKAPSAGNMPPTPGASEDGDRE